MGYTHSPQIVLDGLVLAMDAASQTSFRGILTTNLLADSGMSTYNNVGGDVSSVLVPTSETYKGAIVWKQTLTALSANGVSWLSNGNNPGIGVVTGGGGGLANRYTGHSIFFKPTVPMHGAPIFTCYSNIGGWQSCANYDDMGDGWFRANVIWFDTVTRNDGKYWAINPQTATLNTPIDIYWVGPFKEDRNDSQVVAPFVNGTRGTTAATGGGWVDRSGNNNSGELVNGVGFNSLNLGGLVFDGVDDYINNGTFFTYQSFTNNLWVKPSSSQTTYADIIDNNHRGDQNWVCQQNIDNLNQYAFVVFGSSGQVSSTGNFTLTSNIWVNLTFTYDGDKVRGFNNGNLFATGNSLGTNINYVSQNFNLGRWGNGGRNWNGQLSVVQIYNRALTQQEILQNYNATKGRYGL
jgi:hypothetical protein